MSTIASAGAELVKFFMMLALQEAQRSRMSVKQIEEAYDKAKKEFIMKDPEKIPDV